ncbi:MAG: hypothetical protein VKK04_13105 [Synechococcales bacterium]|nr:hypothetical protein [Synechococcales bacterium]
MTKLKCFVPRRLVQAQIALVASLASVVLMPADALARTAGAGVGYSGQTDVSYCATRLTSRDRNTRINVREGPGTNFEARHYGLSNDWVDILNRNGNPNNWMSAQDGTGYTWYQVGFPASRAYGWVREDFVALPPVECRN